MEFHPSLAAGCAQGTLHDLSAARQLGYYIFWNLRGPNSLLGLAEQDVKNRAKDMGVCNANLAWELVDRNGGLEATLEEVLQSCEEVCITGVHVHADFSALHDFHH